MGTRSFQCVLTVEITVRGMTREFSVSRYITSYDWKNWCKAVVEKCVRTGKLPDIIEMHMEDAEIHNMDRGFFFMALLTKAKVRFTELRFSTPWEFWTPEEFLNYVNSNSEWNVWM